MSRKTLVIIGVALFAALGAGVALATAPFRVESQLLARGAAGEFRIHDKTMKLKFQAKEPMDLAFVKATLLAPTPDSPEVPGLPGGSTGWHGHAGPSLVIVKSGTLTMKEPHRGRCEAETFGPGEAFVHPAGVHAFVNTGPDAVEFYIAYFLPEAASPAPRDEPVPDECS